MNCFRNISFPFGDLIALLGQPQNVSPLSPFGMCSRKGRNSPRGWPQPAHLWRRVAGIMWRIFYYYYARQTLLNAVEGSHFGFSDVQVLGFSDFGVVVIFLDLVWKLFQNFELYLFATSETCVSFYLSNQYAFKI